MLMNHVKDQINGEVRTSRRLQSKRNYPKSGSDVQVRPMPEDGFDFTDWDLSDDSTIPMDKFVCDRDLKADFPRHYLAAALVLFCKQRNPKMEQAYQDLNWKGEKLTSETFDSMVRDLANGLPRISAQWTDEEYTWITQNAKSLAAGAASKTKRACRDLDNHSDGVHDLTYDLTSGNPYPFASFTHLSYIRDMTWISYLEKVMTSYTRDMSWISQMQII